jgi:hypothetical protein
MNPIKAMPITTIDGVTRRRNHAMLGEAEGMAVSPQYNGNPFLNSTKLQSLMHPTAENRTLSTRHPDVLGQE